MSNKVIGGFVVNLLQDVNILRPLIYITADDLGIKPFVMVTKSFLSRDKSNIWMNELQALAADTQAHIYVINSLFDLWTTLSSFSNGFLIAASESDLSSHKETHEILKLTPSAISTITLQHGFECVGFLMNDHHQKQHGDSVCFASDYICGWAPKHLQRNLRPLQHSRYYNLGPTAWIKRTNKRVFSADFNNNIARAMGIVCENLHSVRFSGNSNVNLFMDQFIELADYLDSKGQQIALRPHPGGQYSIKKTISLPKNVVIVNEPSYKVNWKSYSFGISAPSSVLFDLMIHKVPAMVWQDQQKTIDISQHAFLPLAQNVEDMIAFAEHPITVATSSTNQQLSAVFRDEKQILFNYTQFLSKLSGSFLTMTSASAENAETLIPHRLGEIGL